ncbi:MAG: GTPase HflX [Brevinematia bacterium]
MRAILIALRNLYTDFYEVKDSLLELEKLAKTLDIEVVEKIIQSRKDPDPKYFIGAGKLKEIQSKYKEIEELYLIFNNEISPVQARNIEKESGFKVKTRTEIILDIFSQHARSPSSKIQVELAKLEYQLPRIIGRGTELSRLGGRIGTRGPGEQKLEIERRYIRDRIHSLKDKLKEIEREKNTQRKKRLKNSFKIAIAGYTNSGKSSLLKLLTKANVQIEDRLFSTLDTTTKRLWLGDGINVVITDTVGFIKDIPHYLIESFKSTLLDTVNADLVIHLVDASDSNFLEKIKVVDNTLEELGVSNEKVLMCFNKIDMLDDGKINKLKETFKESIFISAKENTGIESLKERIKKHLLSSRTGTSKAPTSPF